MAHIPAMTIDDLTHLMPHVEAYRNAQSAWLAIQDEPPPWDRVLLKQLWDRQADARVDLAVSIVAEGPAELQDDARDVIKAFRSGSVPARLRALIEMCEHLLEPGATDCLTALPAYDRLPLLAAAAFAEEESRIARFEDAVRRLVARLDSVLLVQ